MPLINVVPHSDRIGEHLEELSRFTEADTSGWTRRVFSEAYRESRDWTKRHMRKAGLQVHEDASGNVIGVLPGTSPGPAIVTGSHTDSVLGGGRFDGVVGVLGAVEVARTLIESNVRLIHDLWVVDFLGEEPNQFGISCIGSRAVSGALTAAHLDTAAPGAGTLGEALTATGLDPSALLGAAWDPADVAAYVELHIEQGPRLERSGASIGVVTGIAGIERLMTTFVGRADHAGTMPMDERRDAVVAAAQAVLVIEQTVRCDEGIATEAVATTTRIDAEPGAYNVVPNQARTYTELRSQNLSWLDSSKRRLAEQITAASRTRGVDVDLQWLTDQPPVPAATTMQDHIAAAAEQVDLKWDPVPSGAGHDAAHMAAIAPMGMIFVPSRDGRSHVPEEWTDLEQIADGVKALAGTITNLDHALATGSSRR